MYIQGQVIDASSKQPLAGVLISVVNLQTGSPGDSSTSDSQGFFGLQSDMFNDGDPVVFKLQGYKDLLSDPSQLGDLVALQKSSNAAYYTIGFIALAAIITIALHFKKKKQKISGPEWEDLALKLGIAVGAYFLIVKPILQKLGILGNDNTTTQDKANQTDQDAVKKSLDQAQKTETASYPDADYTNWADDIYNQGISSDPDQDDIKYKVIQANNLTDVLKLVQAFGNREAATGTFTTCGLLGFNCPTFGLAAFLRQVLDPSVLGQINQFMADQNINYTF